MIGEFVFTCDCCAGTPDVMRFESQGELWSYALGWCSGGQAAVVVVTDSHIHGFTL